MHCIEVTPHREYTRNISEARIEAHYVIVNHITSLSAIHLFPEHPRGRGTFVCTKITVTDGEDLFVTETPQQIRGMAG